MEKLFKKLYIEDRNSYYKTLNKKLKKEEKTFIITANPETFIFSEKDEQFKQMFNDKCTSIVPDGIGIVKAANMLGIKVKERIPGVDIATKLLEYCNDLGKSLYLFGAKQEVLDMLKQRLKKEYPNIKLIGATNGYIKNKDLEMKKIASKKPDVVMVALGIPTQEKLIYNHLDEFKKGILIGVGGSFDVISGYKKRAPKLFIKTNTEWLFRIICEPKRIKRFWNNNVKFLLKIKIYVNKVKKDA